MSRLASASLLLVAPALAGCVAGMAASAIGMAAREARGEPQSNAHLKPAAIEACSARAAAYGVVKIIDVQQSSPSRLVVWGTAGDGDARRSFECGFGTKIDYFRLREIAPLR